MRRAAGTAEVRIRVPRSARKNSMACGLTRASREEDWLRSDISELQELHPPEKGLCRLRPEALVAQVRGQATGCRGPADGVHGAHRYGQFRVRQRDKLGPRLVPGVPRDRVAQYANPCHRGLRTAAQFPYRLANDSLEQRHTSIPGTCGRRPSRHLCSLPPLPMASSTRSSTRTVRNPCKFHSLAPQRQYLGGGGAPQILGSRFVRLPSPDGSLPAFAGHG